MEAPPKQAVADYGYVIKYLPLHKAALSDDWHSAQLIISGDSSAATTKITYLGETLLHVAVGTNSAHNMVHNLINLIASADPLQLRTADKYGNTALHFAAKTGNTRAAKELVEKDPGISQTVDKNGVSPLLLAAVYARKETLVYLLGVTEDAPGEDGLSPYQGVAGGELITHTIRAGFFDVALYLVDKYPNLASDRNRRGITAIRRLATMPKDFSSGRHDWFWTKFIYFCIPIKSSGKISLKTSSQNVASQSIKRMGRQGQGGAGLRFHTSLLEWLSSACVSLHLLIWRFLRFIFPLINGIGDLKLIHKQTDQLTKAICTTIMDTRDYTTVWEVLGPATYAAAIYGIHELVEECLRCYPGLIWFKSEGSFLIFNAIKYRQVKVYNLVYQMTSHVAFAAANVIDGENALHIVARIALPHRLSTVTGAALQMQCELQWFKEVENFVQPSFRDILNREKKSPKMLFTEEHADMVAKGEKWMKDTSSSSMVVAALIFTVAFAAIFTVPGGLKNDGTGTPQLSKDRIFILFATSDAVALFASATSVLMFLAILTSRFAEDDFLYALPKRLIIGLLSLFISIATTMVAFSATLGLLFLQDLAWVFLPVGLIACIPVTFFVLLQFPLLVELFVSTYGPSIFRKQSNLVLY